MSILLPTNLLALKNDNTSFFKANLFVVPLFQPLSVSSQTIQINVSWDTDDGVELYSTI